MKTSGVSSKSVCFLSMNDHEADDETRNHAKSQTFMHNKIQQRHHHHHHHHHNHSPHANDVFYYDHTSNTTPSADSHSDMNDDLAVIDSDMDMDERDQSISIDDCLQSSSVPGGSLGLEVEVEEEGEEDEAAEATPPVNKAAVAVAALPLDKEIENEKKIYEQKLQSLRHNLNEQLTRFEQTERVRMEEKLKQVQRAYAELKGKFEREGVRKSSSNSSSGSASVFSSVGVQTSDTVHETADLVKRLQAENGELRQRIESERRQFRLEREQWLSDKQRYLQFQNISGLNAVPNKRNSINVLGSSGGEAVAGSKYNQKSIVTLCGPPIQNLAMHQQQQLQQQNQVKQQQQQQSVISDNQISRKQHHFI